MGKFIELELLTTSMGTDTINPMLLDISQVSAVLHNHGMYRVYIGSTRFELTKDSYNKLCSALKEYKEPSESILCNLQHDHTWIKQGLFNLIKMIEEGSLSIVPPFCFHATTRIWKQVGVSSIGAFVACVGVLLIWKKK